MDSSEQFYENPLGWITRRLYDDEAEATADARLAAAAVRNVQFYIVEHPVDPRLTQNWKHPTNWQIRSNKPVQRVTRIFRCEPEEVWIMVCEISPVIQHRMF
jgi:hypothetical protein